MMMTLANAEVPPLCSHRQLLETFRCRILSVHGRQDRPFVVQAPHDFGVGNQIATAAAKGIPALGRTMSSRGPSARDEHSESLCSVSCLIFAVAIQGQPP